MATKAKEGYYKVINPNKIMLPLEDSILKNRILKDEEGNILFKFRSSWEYFFMEYLDSCDELHMWGYECDTIEYYDPTTIVDGNMKKRNYFIDFIVYWKSGFVEYIEVKPFYQSIKPVEPKSKTRNGVNTKKYDKYLKDLVTFDVNMAKWNACKHKCENLSMSYGVDYKFSIATEQDRLKNLIK